MEIDDTLVREIVRRLLGVVQPDPIIPFGSAATGKMTRDSDDDGQHVKIFSAGFAGGGRGCASSGQGKRKKD